MALTIRTLSEEAEYNLADIISTNNIKTSTKAIEFVLEKYSPTLKMLESEKNETRRLRNQLLDAEIKLMKIVEGFSLISEMIESKKNFET